VDPDNAQLVIFVRSKMGVKRWLPLNVLNGGAQANGLVKGLESDLTRETCENTLKREVARMIYKERAQMEDMVRKNFPPMKFAKVFEYGMCILNRDKPRESVMGTLGVMVLPQEEDIVAAPLENAAAAATTAASGVFDNLQSGLKSFLGGIGGAPKDT
jgi:hypothetical protein